MHVDRNDVFWMIPVRNDAVEVDFRNARARLRVFDLDVFDDHDLANSLTQGLGIPTPPIPGVLPVRARVSFDVEWNGTVAMAPIENSSQNFKGSFLSTGATITWSADQPGFHFQSDLPPDPKANLVSVLGNEQNGVFFIESSEPIGLESELQQVACGTSPPAASCQLTVNQWNWYLVNKINPAAQVLVIGDGTQPMSVQQYLQARSNAGLF